jgi:hypothetical protein
MISIIVSPQQLNRSHTAHTLILRAYIRFRMLMRWGPVQHYVSTGGTTKKGFYHAAVNMNVSAGIQVPQATSARPRGHILTKQEIANHEALQHGNYMAGPIQDPIPGLQGWPVAFKFPVHGSCEFVSAYGQVAHSEINWLLTKLSSEQDSEFAMLRAVNSAAKALKHNCAACLKTARQLAVATGLCFCLRGHAERCGNKTGVSDHVFRSSSCFTQVYAAQWSCGRSHMTSAPL